MRRLGKYELREEIGRGGFGVVHHAHDTSLDVPRALKILHPILNSDPAFIQRFRREARVVARLRHPNIIPVYDLGQEEGWLYLVMEYMSGGSLKARIQEGPIPFADAVRILHQIGAGLAFAHDQEIIHRDVKPGNILFDEHGVAEIGDFGFARSLMDADTSTTLSLTGGALGTPAYMAPEAWDGYGWTQAADLYSLACVFVEMLTGSVLFDSNSPVQAMKKHVIDGPSLPEHWPDGVPPGLNAILLKALAKDPNDRFPNVRAFVGEVEELAAGRTARAPAEAPLPTTAGQLAAPGAPAPEPDEPKGPVKAEASPAHTPKTKQPALKEKPAVRKISLPKFRRGSALEQPNAAPRAPGYRWWALPALLAPGTVLLLIFRIIPLIATFVYSLQARYLYRLNINFIGLEQYGRVLTSPGNREAFLNILLLLAVRFAAIFGTGWLLQRAWKQAARVPTWLVMASSAALPFLLTIGWTISAHILKVRGAPLNGMYLFAGDTSKYLYIILFEIIRTAALASGIGLFLYALLQKGLPPGSEEGQRAVRRMRNLALAAGAVTALQAYDPVVLSSNFFQVPSNLILSYIFAFYNLGQGSAVAGIQSILLLICVGIALRIWTRSRAGPGDAEITSDDERPPTGQSRLFISQLVFIWLAALLPYAGMMWTYWKYDWGNVCEMTARNYWCDWSWSEYFVNNLALPGLMIWLIQIPVTVVTAYALTAFQRQDHPARKIILPLLAFAAATGEVLFLGAMSMVFRTIDPNTMLRQSYYPFVFNFPGILLLVYVFDRMKRHGEGPDNSQPGREIISKALPWVLLIGTISMYLGSQRFDLHVFRERIPGDWTAGVVMYDALNNFQVSAALIPKAVFPLAIPGGVALAYLVREIIRRFSSGTAALQQSEDSKE